MFYQLPPVGDVVVTSKKVELTQQPFLLSESVRFYQSGTAALSAAICAVKQSKPCPDAEVILPAYACPDLVSAVIFAGVKPVLVDVEENRPWLDLNLLEEAITAKTIAIIAVNLFGIDERWQALKTLAQHHELVLIEDSAQYFPGKDETPDWGGDLVVFSFGRGKPVSLLGGGAVWCRDAGLFSALAFSEPVVNSLGDKLSFFLKTKLYNAMISPRLYWLPASLPFLHLGETRYHELEGIHAMDQQRLDLLASNIVRYQNNEYSLQCRQMMDLMLDNMQDVINLPRSCGVNHNRRLLRYPILVEPGLRTTVYNGLKKAGLGVSMMYPASLVNLSGLADILGNKTQYSNAEKFASMILTLPIKACVSDSNMKIMSDTFMASCKSIENNE